MTEKSELFLPEQICFPLYASSRMITRLYKPLLEELELTYPQYLVLMVLWQEEQLSVSELGKRLYLNTNTLTPLIKKMKDKGLVKKTRSDEDERTVFITITPKAKDLQKSKDGSIGIITIASNVGRRHRNRARDNVAFSIEFRLQQPG